MSSISESSTSPRRLPEAWIGRIFSHMQGHYGTRWLNTWRIGQALPDGQDVGVVNAMAIWAEGLCVFASQEGAEAIGRALKSLPADPPSLPAFRALVQQFRQPAQRAIAHTPSEEERNENRERIQAAAQAVKVGSGAKFTGWWQIILANPAKYPTISVEFAKEARRFHTGIDEEMAA